MIIHNPILTGSFTFNGTDVSSVTGSSTFSASFASSINSLNAATSSLNSFSASVNTFTASAATTGSNTFVGNQVVTGSLNVSGSITTPGTLTAQTLVVQTITSSVDFVTGSTRFGSLSSNTHVFTGSMSISGSSVRISGGQVDYVLNSTSSIQYSRLSFEENGSDKAQVQYINSAFSSGNRAGRLEICNASSGGQGIAFVSALASFNTPQMFISSSGYIGIGTTNPAALLHAAIPSVTSNSIEIFRLSDGVLCDFKVYLNRGTDVNSSTSVVNTYSSNMSFQTNNTERMRISGSYVGIGTTNIVAPLTIAVSATGASIGATNAQTAYDYSRFRIKHYTDSNLGLSIGYAGANYTYIQACYNEGTSAPLLLNPFNGAVGIGTNTPGSAALTIHTSGSGGGNAGNQVWIRGGNTNVANNSNAIVLSYSDVALYSHAIKTTHNSAAINGNAIDFYVWNYGTDATSTIGTRKMMSVDGAGVVKPSQPSFGVYRSNSSFSISNSSDTILPFNSVTYDVAGNYNTSTYRFYAPIAGKYLFIANVRYDGASAGSYLRTYFTIEGSSGSPVFIYGMALSGPSGYSSNYQTHNISSILNLSAGNWVDVRGGLSVGSVTMHQESSFFGYLLG